MNGYPAAAGGPLNNLYCGPPTPAKIISGTPVGGGFRWWAVLARRVPCGQAVLRLTLMVPRWPEMAREMTSRWISAVPSQIW